MILDKQLQVSNAQAITTGTIVGTNVIDLGPKSYAGNSVGDPSGATEILFSIDTTFTGGTSIVIQLFSADDAALSSNAVMHEQSRPLLTAELTAGSKVQYTPGMPADSKRYFGIKYVVTGTYAAGAISANVTAARQTNR